MEKKIKEIQNYFADKIANGNYEVGGVDGHTIEVIVDDKYPFSLWIANEALNFKTWYLKDSFMNLEFTEEQQESGFKFAIDHRKKIYDANIMEIELAELKKLQEKYPEQLT